MKHVRSWSIRSRFHNSISKLCSLALPSFFAKTPSTDQSIFKKEICEDQCNLWIRKVLLLLSIKSIMALPFLAEWVLTQKNFCREFRWFSQISKEKFARICAICGYGFNSPLKTAELLLLLTQSWFPERQRRVSGILVEVFAALACSASAAPAARCRQNDTA